MTSRIKLSNVTIGRKLAILVITGIGSLLIVGGLSLLGLGAIRGTVQQQQIESDKLNNAQRIGSDLGAVNAIVGHITLSQHCETCHGVAAGGDRSVQASLATEGQSLMKALKSADNTPKPSS